jgi:hypothetical protein
MPLNIYFQILTSVPEKVSGETLHAPYALDMGPSGSVSWYEYSISE